MITRLNPFPGMNPLLELSWSDVHTRLIGSLSDTLAAQGLPGGLRARAEEMLAVEDDEDARHTLRADVAVVESWKRGVPPAWNPEADGGKAVELAVPKLVLREKPVERWVEIRTAHGRLVTVIEVLSPANKRGPGYTRYVTKRQTYENGGVNVVEIDLLRGGLPTVAACSEETPLHGERTLYTICVSRAADREHYEVYHWGLRDPIPAFGVPLRMQDFDVPLDIQPLINRVYDLGYYWQDEPELDRLLPPLSTEERSFAEECLRAAGLK